MSYFAQVGADDPDIREAVWTRLEDEFSNVHYAAVSYFAKVGADDPDTREAIRTRLDDEHGNVRAAAVSYFAQVGVDGLNLKALGSLLDAFPDSLTGQEDRELSETLGAAAAAEATFVPVLLAKAPGKQYFLLDLALSSAAAGRDQQRRTENPLSLPSIDTSESAQASNQPASRR